MTFPTPNPPSWYTVVSCADDRNGILNPGDPIVLTLNKSGADRYELYNYRGQLVKAGSVSGTTLNLGVADECGWFRLYLFGPQTDPTFHDCYGAWCLTVVRNVTGYPANSATLPDNTGGERRDVIMKGVLGIGSSRLQIGAASDINSTSDNITVCVEDAERMNVYWRYDTARPRPLMCQFPNGTVDRVVINDGAQPGSSNKFLLVYVKDASVDGSQVFVSAGPGTNAGTSKVQVFHPDSTTLVESYDNLANANTACVAINASSAYVKVFNGGAEGDAELTSVTAIGTSMRSGVMETVETLHPLGVTRYEGPRNEPRLWTTADRQDVAHEMMLFHDAVHTAVPEAIAMGPCTVNTFPTDGFTAFAQAGGFDYCDEISFHAYNSITAGDFNLGRVLLKQFFDLMDSLGQGNKTFWQTESTHTFTSVYSVAHWHRSRVPLIETLLFEQFGVPKELNMVWYDVSHGFWAYPAWLEFGDGSLVPYAGLYRTLSEETYERVHHHAVDFGSVQANRIFLGSVYTSESDESTMVIVAQSYMDDCSVRLSIHGDAAPIVVVDAWGNETIVPQDEGKITVPVSDVPSYVRLPAGVHASVYSVLDWGPSPDRTVSPIGTAYLSDAVLPLVGDNGYQSYYSPSVGVGTSATNPPDSAHILFSGNLDVDRVVVWCASPWQSQSAMTEFTVQTTDVAEPAEGDWVDRESVSAPASSFVFVTSASNAGCQRETWWNEQWIFDVPLGGTYTCRGVRVLATATSYGGEPDAACVAIGGQGNPEQHLVIQEIAVPTATTPPAPTESFVDTVLGLSPIVYLRMGEKSGTVAYTEVNAPTLNGEYKFSPVLGTPSIVGDGNTAMSTSPTLKGHVAVTHNALLNVGDSFTIMVLLNGAGTPATYNYVAGKGTFAWRLRFVNQKLTLANGQNTLICQSTVTESDSDWHLYVIEKDGSDVHIYRDGVDVSGDVTDITLQNNTSTMYVGSTDGTDVYWGGVDEFALFSGAVGQAAATALFDSLTTPAGPPIQNEAPLLYGSPTQTTQIQASEGDWDNPPTGFSYQWYHCDENGDGKVPIAGATRSDYIPARADIGWCLVCGVTGVNVITSASETFSDVIGPIEARVPPAEGYLIQTRVPGEGWRTVPLTADAITRLNPPAGGWNTQEIAPGLIRVFKNGMWQTVQYPEV